MPSKEKAMRKKNIEANEQLRLDVIKLYRKGIHRCISWHSSMCWLHRVFIVHVDVVWWNRCDNHQIPWKKLSIISFGVGCMLWDFPRIYNISVFHLFLITPTVRWKKAPPLSTLCRYDVSVCRYILLYILYAMHRHCQSHT